MVAPLCACYLVTYKQVSVFSSPYVFFLACKCLYSPWLCLRTVIVRVAFNICTCEIIFVQDHVLLPLQQKPVSRYVHWWGSCSTQKREKRSASITAHVPLCPALSGFCSAALIEFSEWHKGPLKNLIWVGRASRLSHISKPLKPFLVLQNSFFPCSPDFLNSIWMVYIWKKKLI